MFLVRLLFWGFDWLYNHTSGAKVQWDEWIQGNPSQDVIDSSNLVLTTCSCCYSLWLLVVAHIVIIVRVCWTTCSCYLLFQDCLWEHMENWAFWCNNPFSLTALSWCVPLFPCDRRCHSLCAYVRCFLSSWEAVTWIRLGYTKLMYTLFNLALICIFLVSLFGIQFHKLRMVLARNFWVDFKLSHDHASFYSWGGFPMDFAWDVVSCVQSFVYLLPLIPMFQIHECLFIVFAPLSSDKHKHKNRTTSICTPI